MSGVDRFVPRSAADELVARVDFIFRRAVFDGSFPAGPPGPLQLIAIRWFMSGEIFQDLTHAFVFDQTLVKIGALLDDQWGFGKNGDLCVTGGEDRGRRISVIVRPQGDGVAVTGIKSQHNGRAIRPNRRSIHRDEFITAEKAADNPFVNESTHGVRFHAAIRFVMCKEKSRGGFFGISSRFFRDVVVRLIPGDLGARARQVEAAEFASQLRRVQHVRERCTHSSAARFRQLIPDKERVIIRVFLVDQQRVIRGLRLRCPAERHKSHQQRQTQDEAHEVCPAAAAKPARQD